MISSRLLRLAGLTIALALVSACGQSRGPKTVEVAGTVYLDGKPAGGIKVHFSTEEFASLGTTAVDGTYRLADGAIPGENKVYFRKYVDPRFTGDLESGMDAGQQEAMMSATRQEQRRLQKSLERELPPQYSDPLTTKVTFHVPKEGTQKADFHLTSK